MSWEVRAGLLLLIFQAGEALVMDLRDAEKGADVLSVLLLGLGDCGESLSDFLVVVEVHFERGAFGVCVVRHGSRRLLPPSSHDRYCLSPPSRISLSLPAAQCATI